ncbi:hypothetical protein ACJX0J_024584, partial [Zea mays]
MKISLQSINFLFILFTFHIFFPTLTYLGRKGFAAMLIDCTDLIASCWLWLSLPLSKQIGVLIFILFHVRQETVIVFYDNGLFAQDMGRL